jgi:energy-coupling factor transport system permease protein
VRYLHPASLILLGLAFLLAASTRSGMFLLLLGIASSAFSYGLARQYFIRIVRRSRWLLITMLLLFGWMTPGTPVAGVPFATQEGLMLAAENIARLLIAIATVASLLSALAPPALVSGLRTLLAPLWLLGGFRDRLAVRMMLTLEEVEAVRQRANDLAAYPASLSLPRASHGPADIVAAIGSAVLLVVAALA